MTSSVLIEVGVGELIDKISILEIKLSHLCDETKRAHVSYELSSLVSVKDRSVTMSSGLKDLAAQLHAKNASLWQLEERIRAFERRGVFGPEFIAIARSIYHTNDERAALKRRINILCRSRVVEEKSYDDPSVVK